ncbi:uncharacterized protein LOC143564123, partial [Bidens hawaiensis]|uniref:uncharacterized protein LOC143564123 n=1 Tax=Bidens hawaiensis TaxID=980011 RepID=UPI00404A5025
FLQVVIIKAESIDISNTTKVIFGVDPDEYNFDISSYAKSLVRDSFVSLVLHQSPLRLTESLFGEPSSFEVLKFAGGITVTPDQGAYPLQKVQIRFNFSFNYSIQQILDHFGELTSQLKSGLRLESYENLHVSLTNAKGSTVAPQTTVQSSVVLAIGTPSTTRSKQLEQTIKGSPTKNLGLNNTQFGRVKQISLSSYFNSSSGGGGGTLAPSPAPQPHSSPQQPHHHHHHHHHHDKQLPPAKPPSPSKHPLAPPPANTPALPPAATPAPHNIHKAKPPDCHSGYHRKKRNINNHPPLYPPVSQPALPPHIRPPPLRRNHPPPRVPPPPPLSPPPPPPLRPPLPPPPSLPPPILPSPPLVSEMTPASSPLPNVVFARTPPPSKSDSDADPPDITPSASAAAVAACAGVSLRAIPAFLAVMILENIILFN